MLIWAGTDEWRAEVAQVDSEAGRFDATGVQLGILPVPYRLDYVLDTSAGWVTRTMRIGVRGDGWRRSLLLTREPSGQWTSEASAEGDVDLPMPGGDSGKLDDALDVDLGLSPLTNSMPILRSHLHEGAGAAACVMAWVSVPDLTVHRSLQRYEHLRTTATGAVVRFVSGDFTADLLVDDQGFVVDYPQLARRTSGG
jgi:uncharacterized protein